jgi:hypothetical protein
MKKGPIGPFFSVLHVWELISLQAACLKMEENPLFFF